MKHYYLYSAHYLKFNEENNELEHKYKRLSKEMTKRQFAGVVIKEILITLLICSLLISGIFFGVLMDADNGYTIFVLCICCAIFILPGALICFGRLYDYDRYIEDCEEDLINKLFSEEIEELKLFSIEENIKATVWRFEHPLEEKCRLALTKNPNYVADLIKYVKENQHE